MSTRLATLALVCLGAMGCEAETAEPGAGDLAPPGIDGALEDAARSDVTVPDLALPDSGPPDGSVDAGLPLVAVAGPAQAVDVDAEVTLDASASTGAVAWRWDFGDGRGQTEPSPNPVATVRYAAPGRYRATVTVYDAEGARRTAVTLVTVTWPVVWYPQHSASVIAVRWNRSLGSPVTDVAAVSTDGGTLTRARVVGDTPEIIWQVPTCEGPRTVAELFTIGDEGVLAVTCPSSDRVVWHDLADGAPLGQKSFGYGSAPFGIVASGSGVSFSVTLQGYGSILSIADDGFGPIWGAVQQVGSDVRGLAVLPSGRLAASRWRSGPEGGAIFVVAGAPWTPEYYPQTPPADGQWESTGGVTRVTLAVDPQLANDTEIGGVPSYLDTLVVSPDGRTMAVPSLQANRFHGRFLNGQDLDFDRTLRAVVSFVDLGSEEGQVPTEDFDARVQFDGRGFASAAAWSPRGDYLYVATRGSRTVERLDRLDGTQAGTLTDVGLAVEGMVVVGDKLVLDASLDRALHIYPLDAFSDPDARPVSLPLVAAEPLDPVLYRGKVLFNDSADERLSREGYIACAHCHLDGDSDRIVWDFTDRGEGLRNTISLRGRAGMGHGPLHWSANFDEVQDFEHDLRGPFGGTGLMDDADFFADDRDRSLGAPKAGLSPDLDALAAYVSSLRTFGRSPWRASGEEFWAEAEAGAEVFARLACAGCHGGEAYTDSGFEDGAPVLHAVGTLPPSSGQRLGQEPLVALDTPTLRDLWASAPYLHDGSAPDLAAVLAGRDAEDPHAVAEVLDPSALAQLLAWLRAQDASDR